MQTEGPLIRTLLILASVVSMTAPYQERKQIFRGRADLVQVDVVVTGKDGRPVRGLAPADFTILDRGKPQSIATFEEIIHAYPSDATVAIPNDLARDVSDNSSGQSDRLVVLVLDDLRTQRAYNDRVKALAGHIVRRLGPRASMALLFTSGDHGVEVTDDRALLLQGIGKFAGRVINPRVPFGPPCGVMHCPWFKTVQDAARTVGGGDGRRKAFVYLGPGMPEVDLLGVFDTMRARPRDKVTWSLPPVNWAEDAALSMMESLRESNVATYVVDIRGTLELSAGWDALPEVEPDHTRRAEPIVGWRWQNPFYLQREAAQLISEASGGFAINDSPDLDADLNRLLDDLDNYYLLGFYAPDPTTKEWHNLDVRVSRPDVTVRHRRGYGSGGPPKPPKNKDPMVALSASVLPTTDLRLRLHAAALAPRAAAVPVVMTLEVQGRHPTGRFSAAEKVKVTTLAVDLKKKKVVQTVTREAQVRLPERTTAGEVRYQVVTKLDLRPGAYQFRTSARSQLLDRAGSVYLTIDVPDSFKGPLALGGLVVGLDSAAATSIPTSTDAAVELPFAPVLDREFTARDLLRVCFDVWQKHRGSTSAEIALVDAADAIVWSTSASPRRDRRFEALVPLAGLAAGPYRLRVTARGAIGTASREVAITIRPL